VDFGETAMVKVPTEVGAGDGLAVRVTVAAGVSWPAGTVVAIGVGAGVGTAGPVVGDGDVKMARAATISAPTKMMMMIGITRVFTVDIVSSSVMSLTLVLLILTSSSGY
jgi:hypothetical protein